MAKAQHVYKRDFDARLRRLTKPLQLGNTAFVRKGYYKPEKKQRHNLYPISDGPYSIISVRKDTVVLQVNSSEEQCSHDQVLQGPIRQTQVISNPQQGEEEPETQTFDQKNVKYL